MNYTTGEGVAPTSRTSRNHPTPPSIEDGCNRAEVEYE